MGKAIILDTEWWKKMCNGVVTLSIVHANQPNSTEEQVNWVNWVGLISWLILSQSWGGDSGDDFGFSEVVCLIMSIIGQNKSVNQWVGWLIQTVISG